jgi:hypothetical protein
MLIEDTVFFTSELCYLNDVLPASHLEGPSLLAALGPVLLCVVVRDAVGRYLVALTQSHPFTY